MVDGVDSTRRKEFQASFAPGWSVLTSDRGWGGSLWDDHGCESNVCRVINTNTVNWEDDKKNYKMSGSVKV